MNLFDMREKFRDTKWNLYKIITQGLDGPLYYIGEGKPGDFQGEWTPHENMATEFAELPVSISSDCGRLCTDSTPDEKYGMTRQYLNPQTFDVFAVAFEIKARKW